MSKINAMDLAFATAEAEVGRSTKGRSGKIPAALFSARKNAVNPRAPRWTKEEDDFIRQNLGLMTDEEIGKHLGRSKIAVTLRWKRDLHLPAPSKHPDFLTGHQAAYLLGVDPHKIVHWCDEGLIPFRNMAGGRKMRLIKKVSFYCWVVSPSNWIYFNWREIPNHHLRRLCELRSQRWGDEWLDTPTVAKMHGDDLSSKDVQRLIYRGELPAVQVSTSRGGRHKDPAWLNWFVLRSDAEKAVFIRGRGQKKVLGWQPSERAVAWIKKAASMGMTYADICRTMGNPVTSWTLRQFMVKKLNIDLTNRSLNS